MVRPTTGFSQRSQDFLCVLCGQKLLTAEIAEKETHQDRRGKPHYPLLSETRRLSNRRHFPFRVHFLYFALEVFLNSASPNFHAGRKCSISS